MFNCPICTRETPPEYQERHHLVPRAKKGKEAIYLCRSCGDMLHKLFTNKELAKEYNTLGKILVNPDVQKWISWVVKKPYDFSICMATKKRKN